MWLKSIFLFWIHQCNRPLNHFGSIGGVCWDVPRVDWCSAGLYLLTHVCFFRVPSHSSLSPLTFVFFTVLFSLFCPLCSYTTALPSGFSFLLISAVSLCCNPGGVSSGQSYSTSQYESGLQQRSQQGEQQGHQPRPLLHTAGWVAVADWTPRRAYKNRWTLLF